MIATTCLQRQSNMNRPPHGCTEGVEHGGHHNVPRSPCTAAAGEQNTTEKNHAFADAVSARRLWDTAGPILNVALPPCTATNNTISYNHFDMIYKSVCCTPFYEGMFHCGHSNRRWRCMEVVGRVGGRVTTTQTHTHTHTLSGW